jgi:hypothetical protein
MTIFHLPPAVEISRLKRMKDAVLGVRPKQRSSIVATDDWIAEIDARLSVLERSLSRPVHRESAT